MTLSARIVIAVCLPLLPATQAAEAADEVAIQVGSRRELLVDDDLIDSMQGAALVTRPLAFAGDQLFVNFATSAAGSVRVEVRDAHGHAMDGFRLDDCPPIFGDQLDRAVTWAGKARLSDLQGKPIRLRVVLKDADLHSFQFRGVR